MLRINPIRNIFSSLHAIAQQKKSEIINSALKTNFIVKTDSSNLTNNIKYNFARNVKNTTQLIIHSNAEIQNMHIRRQKKRINKQWQIFTEKDEKLKVSLIGLPNCGKSSLFNCLIGQRLAIVDKQYGMTRDRRQYTILQGMMSIIDTPGIEVDLLTKSNKKSHYQELHQGKQRLKQDIFEQTVKALNQSNVIMFVIDTKKGQISEQEIILGKYLKSFNRINSTDKQKNKCQILIVPNKCDGGDWEENYFINQVYSKLPFLVEEFQENTTIIQNSTENLPTNNVFFCSAEQGTGLFQVLHFLQKQIPQQLRSFHNQRRTKRRERFEELVKKMKEQIKQINQTVDKQKLEQDQQTNAVKKQKRAKAHNKPAIKKMKIKQWERDFRNLNPDPQNNEDLDHDNVQQSLIKPEDTFSSGKRGVDIKNLKMKNSIKICFMGRPNVGKSSLINQLLGQEKMIVSDIPHTTRDSLTTKILYKNRKIQLIDTAGLNTPRIKQNEQEYLRKVQISTMVQVYQSQVVVFMMDAYSAFNVDDFTLIKKVIQQGRPIIIVVNKWQAIKQQYKNKAKRYLINQMDKNLGQLHGHPIVFISVKMLENIDLMMDKIINAYDKWNKRISTGLLNNWLQKFKKLDNLPKDQERTLKINYIIQAKVRPPHFIFFVNNKAMFKDNYMRFLLKNMSQEFELDGIPIRHTLRSTNNKQNEMKKKSKHNQPKKVNKTKAKMDQLKKKYGDFSI